VTRPGWARTMPEPVTAPRRAPSRDQRAVLIGATVVGFVLRFWDLGVPLTYDETWTGYYSHLPLGSMFGALRRDDPHPPLDYLLRHFLGSPGSTFALRVPSVVFGCLTLLLVLWWMWDRGWFGVLVVVLTSLSYFELLYSHIARMYSLAALLGTLAAVAAERWLGDGRGRGRWRWAMGAALLVGLFDHTSFLLLAGGLVLVAGLRRDGEAWRWRATIVGALAVWAVTWGPAFRDQLHAGHFDPLPLTSISSIGDTLNGLVTDYAALTIPVVILLALGGWCLWRTDGRLAAVAAALFGAPLAAACLIGLHEHILFSRLLAVSVWAMPVLLAALVERAGQISHRLGLAAGAVVAILVLTSVWAGVHVDDGSAPGLAVLARSVRPGDAVAVYPDYLWTLAHWDLGAPDHPSLPPELAGLHGYVFVVGDRPFDGRLWVYVPKIYSSDVHGWSSCPSPVPDGGVYTVRCFER
jgi:hypothetical protein